MFLHQTIKLNVIIFSATSVSVLSGAKRFDAESISIDESVLIDTCLEFCEILQHEFVFAPPCVQLEDAIRSTIKYMTKQQIFFRTVMEIPITPQLLYITRIKISRVCMIFINFTGVP